MEALQRASAGRNALLEDLKAMQPANLGELTSRASGDVLQAMNAFVARVMGTADAGELRASSSSTTHAELGRLLYWLMVVGYSLRTIEARFDVERTLGVPPSRLDPFALPPGAGDGPEQ